MASVVSHGNVSNLKIMTCDMQQIGQEATNSEKPSSRTHTAGGMNPNDHKRHLLLIAERKKMQEFSREIPGV